MSRSDAAQQNSSARKVVQGARLRTTIHNVTRSTQDVPAVPHPCLATTNAIGYWLDIDRAYPQSINLNSELLLLINDTETTIKAECGAATDNASTLGGTIYAPHHCMHCCCLLAYSFKSGPNRAACQRRTAATGSSLSSPPSGPASTCARPRPPHVRAFLQRNRFGV